MIGANDGILNSDERKKYLIGLYMYMNPLFFTVPKKKQPPPSAKVSIKTQVVYGFRGMHLSFS